MTLRKHYKQAYNDHLVVLDSGPLRSSTDVIFFGSVFEPGENGRREISKSLDQVNFES